MMENTVNILDRIKNIEIALDKGLLIITSIPDGIAVDFTEDSLKKASKPGD